MPTKHDSPLRGVDNNLNLAAMAHREREPNMGGRGEAERISASASAVRASAGSTDPIAAPGGLRRP